MCHLLETIKLENGILHNLKYHNIRFNRARYELFGITQDIDLASFIDIPKENRTGLFRCRLVYSSEIEKVEFIPHHPKEIKSLKLVFDDEIDYSFKYLNRERLNKLLKMKNDCDEIIIIKKGLVSDCSIGNLIFHDGQKWWTPSAPLLNGTRRMQLLNDGLICEKEITANQIQSFQTIGIINVFYGMENLPKISVSSVKE